MHLPHSPGEPCPLPIGAEGQAFAAKKLFVAPLEGGLRRARLFELNSHFHCSVIGTCLTTTELRRLIPRFKDVDRVRATDVEIHHAAVELAGEDGAGSKALNKALDDRYQSSVKRFRPFKTAELLAQHWRQCVAQGDIPGAYWAVLTHPLVDADLRRAVFGEVHMLSHLVGASNRADIRRLVHLEQQNDELRQDLEQHKMQLQANAADALQLRQAQLLLQQQVVVARAAHVAHASDDQPPLEMELQQQSHRLQRALEQKEAALRHQVQRREQVEIDAVALKGELIAAQQALSQAQRLIAHYQVLLDHEEQPDHLKRQLGQVVRSRKILYVGGRPAAIQAIRALVESAGGELVSHGGSLEQRRGMLPALVASSDLVLFPVDCIDHDSVASVKRECDRHGIPYHPLRTSSAGAFLALITRIASIEQIEAQSA